VTEAGRKTEKKTGLGGEIEAERDKGTDIERGVERGPGRGGERGVGRGVKVRRLAVRRRVGEEWYHLLPRV